MADISAKSRTGPRGGTYLDAWQMILDKLRADMSRVQYDTWVAPLHPMSYQDQVFTLGASNTYAREWVEKRLTSTVTHMLQGMFSEPVRLAVVVDNPFYDPDGRPAPLIVDARAPAEPQPESPPAPTSAPEKKGGEKSASVRKTMLQRAYGSERARIIQPERGMFITQYFFLKWTPILGHSAAATVLAARSLCYWNPITGEMRNEVETEMDLLARRAAVSLRTVKDVLSSDMIRRYFIRYRVRRMMTEHGIRTAGIPLRFPSDNPLPPENQKAANLPEEEAWYPAEYAGERSF